MTQAVLARVVSMGIMNMPESDSHELNKRIAREKKRDTDMLPLITCFSCGVDYFVRPKVRRCPDYRCERKQCPFRYYGGRLRGSNKTVFYMTPEQASKIPEVLKK